MVALDTRGIVNRLRTFDSLAVISRVTSTNFLGKKIAAECIENDIPLPAAMIIAGEQLAGRGREARSWYSPPGKGIYATMLHTCSLSELPYVPLAIGNIVALFLRETWSLDARIKWPNDILIGRSKAAGILIEARVREENAALVIGTGVNIESIGSGAPHNATSVADTVENERPVDLQSATIAFIEHMDEHLSRPIDGEEVLERWQSLSVHQTGEPVSCTISGRLIEGHWIGIDAQGRAMIRQNEETIFVTAGELMIRDEDQG